MASNQWFFAGGEVSWFGVVFLHRYSRPPLMRSVSSLACLLFIKIVYFCRPISAFDGKTCVAVRHRSSDTYLLPAFGPNCGPTPSARMCRSVGMVVVGWGTVPALFEAACPSGTGFKCQHLRRRTRHRAGRLGSVVARFCVGGCCFKCRAAKQLRQFVSRRAC